MTSQPANSQVVNNKYCSSGSCYECNTGYSWDGDSCEIDNPCTGESDGATPDGCNGADEKCVDGECCGDDGSEKTESCSAYPGSGINCDTSMQCCNGIMCQYNNICYARNSAHSIAGDTDLKTYCDSLGNWADCDATTYTLTSGATITFNQPKTCEACGLTWIAGGETSAFGEYDSGTATECCGDDSGEHLRTFYNVYSGSSNNDHQACCNSNTDCVNIYNKCISEGDFSGRAYYCKAGNWYICTSSRAKNTVDNNVCCKDVDNDDRWRWKSTTSYTAETNGDCKFTGCVSNGGNCNDDGDCCNICDEITGLCVDCIDNNEYCSESSDCCGYTESTGGFWCDFRLVPSDPNKGECVGSSDCEPNPLFSITCPPGSASCLKIKNDRNYACCTPGSVGGDPELSGGLANQVSTY